MIQVPANWKPFRTVQVIYLIMILLVILMDIIGLLMIPPKRLLTSAQLIYGQLLFFAGAAALLANLFFNTKLLRVIKEALPPIGRGLVYSRILLVLFLLINALLLLVLVYGLHDELKAGTNFRSRNDIILSRLLLLYICTFIIFGFYIAVRQVRLLWQYNSYQKRYFSDMVNEIGSS